MGTIPNPKRKKDGFGKEEFFSGCLLGLVGVHVCFLRGCVMYIQNPLIGVIFSSAMMKKHLNIFLEIFKGWVVEG